MLVNFQDNPAQPYSPATAQSIAFDQVNRFYQESSYGQTSVTGDVYGWFMLPMTSTTCDTAKITTLADQAATSAGVNLSAYAHRLYAFPTVGACSWRGMGTVGGNPSRAYVNGGFAVRTVSHELGHNLGLYHSKSEPCASGSCTTVEYGDDHDVMGKSGVVAHTNAFQKERLGWLNYSASPPIETISRSGNYWIDSYAPPGTAAKALKVLKAVDASGNQTWYYFEARAKYGFDGGIVPGVVVHRGSTSVPSVSTQLDLDPVTSTFDGVLDPSQTFSDATLGLSVKTLWTDSTGAMLDVAYGGPPCTTTAPTVAFTPSAALWTQPGKPADVTLSITNNDASECQAAGFNLSSMVPTGWLATFDRVSLTLDAGASGSANLQVTPPAGSAGQYGFSAGVTRSGPTAYASGTVTVADALQVTIAVSGSKAGYSLAAKVLAAGQPVQGASVTFTVTGPAGSSLWLGAVTDAGGVAVARWRPRKSDSPGVYQVRAEASAADLKGIATTAFSR
jgi:hypothetical protein